jgi:uncharacterized protein involved in tellurium resistance
MKILYFKYHGQCECKTVNGKTMLPCPNPSIAVVYDDDGNNTMKMCKSHLLECFRNENFNIVSEPRKESKHA